MLSLLNLLLFCFFDFFFFKITTTKAKVETKSRAHITATTIIVAKLPFLLFVDVIGANTALSTFKFSFNGGISVCLLGSTG